MFPHESMSVAPYMYSHKFALAGPHSRFDEQQFASGHQVIIGSFVSGIRMMVLVDVYMTYGTAIIHI